MKITIIGPSGGGKSTLARNISQTFNISRLEIDRLWFKYDGHKYSHTITPEQKDLILGKIRTEVETFLTTNEEWVIDGTYSKLQPLIASEADIVVLIERPLLQRISSHLKRVLKKDNRHPEISLVTDFLFIKTIIKRWWKGENKKMKEFSKQYENKVVTLTSFKEIDEFFQRLRK